MNNVIEVLMMRDNISYEDAKQLVIECYYEMIETSDLDCIMDILGLEPDYIFDIIEIGCKA